MVSGVSIKRIKQDELYLDKLPAATRRAFLYFSKRSLPEKTDWYLAGGTALALQVGHRKSVDLDFFTPQYDFKEDLLERELMATKHWQTTIREKGTIYGIFMKAKMSFIAYPFFKPSKQRLYYGKVHILSPQDIAAMKIIAISQRGRKRDFVDLYWYCKNIESLSKAIKRALRQYAGQEKNIPHILKSLTYFDDAETDPMPELYFNVRWPVIKAFFRKEVSVISKDFLR